VHSQRKTGFLLLVTQCVCVGRFSFSFSFAFSDLRFLFPVFYLLFPIRFTAVRAIIKIPFRDLVNKNPLAGRGGLR
jgi:hypothetical protein